MKKLTSISNQRWLSKKFTAYTKKASSYELAFLFAICTETYYIEKVSEVELIKVYKTKKEDAERPDRFNLKICTYTSIDKRIIVCIDQDF